MVLDGDGDMVYYVVMVEAALGGIMERQSGDYISVTGDHIWNEVVGDEVMNAKCFIVISSAR
jgi:hypothetical protein